MTTSIRLRSEGELSRKFKEKRTSGKIKKISFLDVLR
jgi:hypothetical protein